MLPARHRRIGRARGAGAGRLIRRERGLDTPIYLVSELKGVELLSLAPLGEVSGYIYLDNETPGFTAKEVFSRSNAMRRASSRRFSAR